MMQSDAELREDLMFQLSLLRLTEKMQFAAVRQDAHRSAGDVLSSLITESTDLQQ